jgi:hypothetical protein
VNSRKRAIAVMVAVLLIGCLLGAFGTWLWGKRAQNALNLYGRYSEHDYSIRIFDRLQITSEQETMLKEILEESRREILACRGEMQDKMDLIRSKANEKIAEILDESQRSMFERLLQESELRTRGNHGDRGRKSKGH